MSPLFQEHSELDGICRFQYLRLSERGEYATRIEALPGAVAMLVVTRGSGAASLEVNGQRVEAADRASDSVLTAEGRLLTYAAVERMPEDARLQLSVEGGQSISATIVQITAAGRGLLRRFRGALPCHLCKRLVRAAITALLAAMGIPDITIGDDVLANLLAWLDEPHDLPPALRVVLEWLFDDPDTVATKFLDLLRRFLNNLPFNQVAQAVCEELGFCRPLGA